MQKFTYLQLRKAASRRFPLHGNKVREFRLRKIISVPNRVSIERLIFQQLIEVFFGPETRISILEFHDAFWIPFPTEKNLLIVVDRDSMTWLRNRVFAILEICFRLALNADDLMKKLIPQLLVFFPTTKWDQKMKTNVFENVVYTNNFYANFTKFESVTQFVY